MNFYSIRDLRTETKTICETVQNYGQAVITNNGKPSMLLMDISEEDFESLLQAVRQAKAILAFQRMRSKATKSGFLDDAEIEAEIAAARKERRERQDA